MSAPSSSSESVLGRTNSIGPMSNKESFASTPHRRVGVGGVGAVDVERVDDDDESDDDGDDNEAGEEAGEEADDKDGAGDEADKEENRGFKQGQGSGRIGRALCDEDTACTCAVVEGTAGKARARCGGDAFCDEASENALLSIAVVMHVFGRAPRGWRVTATLFLL